ncbi:xylosidase [Streptomyces sp. NPDC088387]|uniref:xylosidase n=1 Tax=Streptomyces sp. NPDC088387 TaxID=3365859 RepID=UPI0037F107A1
MTVSHRKQVWSRRKVLATAVGGSAAAGVAAFGITRAATASSATSVAGDVVGKVSVGYQGWFAADGDGSPIDGWWHWSEDKAQPPSPSNTTIVSWPDTREYTHTYRSAYANLGNGGTADLFSSHDDQTVNTHFQWMQQNGIDTVALQRFNPTGDEGPVRDAMTAKVRTAAEAYGRKFYIMYDVTSWTNMQSEIKTDWTERMKAYTSSSAYAMQNGRPVVCIWGFGFNDSKRTWEPGPCLDVVKWFQDQGCYVIGGVPTWWRTGDRDSRAGFIDVYHAFDMLSPWLVGRIGSVGDADHFYDVATVPDMEDCAANGIDYQPCVLPGSLHLGQRAHGDFMWRQFYNMVRAGVQGIYVSMFDEYNEGNQIAKTAETQSWVPTDADMLALDEDGTACSSDYYLRLTGDGGRMLKGTIALTATRPTRPQVSTAATPAPSPTTTAAASTVASYIGRTITLRAKANDKYVTAERAGAKALIANRTAVGGWEKFDVLDGGGGTIALRARVNGKYVTAENAGAEPLIANRAVVGSYEVFQLVVNAGGTVSLLAKVNGRYVTAENGGNGSLVANRSRIGNWERFTVTIV